MRPVLHLFSVALVLPILALASAFVILGRAIAAGSSPGVLDQLLDDAVWLIPWGLLGAGATLLIIALGGLFVRTRWLAGPFVAILGIGSTLTVIVLAHAHSDVSFDQVPFFVPGVVASCIGAWFTLTERPRDSAPAR